MMVVMMVMMVLLGGNERRAGKHHQQQGCGKNLFHGMNVAQIRPRMVADRWRRIKKANGCVAGARRQLRSA
jgi:hypothetical protein